MLALRRLTVALALSLALPFAVQAQTALKVAPPPTQDQIVSQLMWGNFLYSVGVPVLPGDISPKLRASLVAGQAPKAIILSCADSRVPPEHLFRQGLGEIFVSRIAGNVPMVGEIATIEYGVEHLGVPVLFVLGHTSCGAVKAAVGQYQAPSELSPALTALVEEILPAVKAAAEGHPTDLVGAAVHENALLAAENLIARSAIVREAVESGKLKVFVGVYDLASGRVTIDVAGVR